MHYFILAAAALLELSPEFETESGGMVIVTVEVAAPELPGQSGWGLRERQEVLRMLSARAGERFPGLSVRVAGGELLLSPVREAAGAKE